MSPYILSYPCYVIYTNTYDSCLNVYYVYIYIYYHPEVDRISKFSFFCLRTFEIPYSIYSRMIIYIYINIQHYATTRSPSPFCTRTPNRSCCWFHQWPFQVPKLEVPTISSHIIWVLFFIKFPQRLLKIWQGVWESRKVTLGS